MRIRDAYLTVTEGRLEYPQITAQDLKVGQIVRYDMGNLVVRLHEDLFLSVNSNGLLVRITESSDPLGHGLGDLLPLGTSVNISFGG